jgi:hypothetical protein
MLGLIYQHHRVLVKPNVRTVLTPERIFLAHYDRMVHLLFLRQSARLGFLDREHHHIAYTRIPPARPPEHFENAPRLPSGVVGNIHNSARLKHDSLDNDKMFVARERTTFSYLHSFADLSSITRIVRFDARRAPHILAVFGMLHQPLHCNHNRIPHFVGYHRAHQYAPLFFYCVFHGV